MPTWVLICLIFSTPALLLVVFRLFSVALIPLKIPLKMILGKKLPQGRWFKKVGCKINLVLGIFEYYFRALRHFIFVPLFTTILIVQLVRFAKGTDLALYPIGWSLFFLTLIMYSFHHTLVVTLRMGEFLRTYPNLHPKIFFHAYYHLFGPFRYKLPKLTEDSMVYPGKTSFKKYSRSKQSIKPMILILWDVAHFAHMTLKTYKNVGAQYTRDIADIIGSIWGKSILEKMNASLEVFGREKLENLEGKLIIMMNHKSQLDFALGFFALSNIRLAGGRGIRLRFITAKDHFIDNPIVYELMRIGKAMEAVDMIMIDRKKKGTTFLNLQQAAKDLANKEIDLVIYPQETRAQGNINRSQKRRDAGYYTTVPPQDIQSNLGHLRKGAAYLAVDTLIELAKTSREPLNLVFVGLNGTATALSKQSFKVQTETDIRFNIGEVVTLLPDLVTNLSKPEGAEAKNDEEKKYLDLVNQLNQTIDEKLVSSLGIHENLRHRFLLDLKGHFRFTTEKIDLVERNLDRFEKESSVSYQILDRIYACKPSEWNPYISELAHLLMDQSLVTRFETLRNQVTLRMLGQLKKNIHERKVVMKNV